MTLGRLTLVMLLMIFISVLFLTNCARSQPEHSELEKLLTDHATVIAQATKVVELTATPVPHTATAPAVLPAPSSIPSPASTVTPNATFVPSPEPSPTFKTPTSDPECSKVIDQPGITKLIVRSEAGNIREYKYCDGSTLKSIDHLDESSNVVRTDIFLNGKVRVRKYFTGEKTAKIVYLDEMGNEISKEIFIPVPLLPVGHYR